MEQVEGRRPVAEAIRAGRVRTLLAQEGLPSLVPLSEQARQAGVIVREVPAEVIVAEARSDAPQGVIARCAALPRRDLEDLVEPAPALVLVLDGVVDPRNLGAAARAAEEAGATGLVISRHEGSPLTPAAAKAAAGALEWLPVAVVAGIPTALRRLRQLGLWVVVLDADGPDPIWGLPLASEPLALVVGAEGRGARRLVRDSADAIVRIPLYGRVGSLNAAAAAAVALFEVRRVRSGENSLM